MACVAVLSLMRTLELEFLQPLPRPILQQMELIISSNKEFIQSLREKLGFLIQLFDENRTDGVEAIKELETKLRDVAFRVEDDIEIHVVDLYKEADNEDFGIAALFGEELQGDSEAKKTQKHSCRLGHVLQQAIQDIDAIKEDLEVEKVRMMEYKHVVTAVQVRKTTALDDVIPQSEGEDIMVGKSNEFETIRKMLIQHPSKQREVVSIQGMGGIGKTTLARRLYEHPSIVSHFDKRAWAVASQHHSKFEMLKGLLKSMGCGDDGTEGRLEGRLAEKLYRNLICQRYLVVIDDVWSNEAWDDVKTCFPDNENRSRVLFTTRVAEVATHIGSNHEFSHQMHWLDQSESWDLFSKKACISHGVEFETIARPIVEKCQGLPLAIVVVAGLFSKLNTLDEWKNTANALSSSASTLDDDECSRVLSLSYCHLPYNLKACFLYLGVFPEDVEINAKNLARLWAAEGLVKAFKYESFEAVARRYIKELSDRNLILVSTQSCCGRKIKSFKVHDLLHAFCVKEAQSQNLLHVVYKSGSNFPPKGVRWVRIQLEDFDISVLHSCSKNSRSIFYFVSIVWGDVCLDLESFNLCRVLFLHNSFYMPGKTLDLIHLRYLLSTYSAAEKVIDGLLPFKTWNLQTLACVYSKTRRNILEFPQLHYIHCNKFNGVSPKSVHQNLQTIIHLEASHFTQEYLTKIPYLKKVHTYGVENKDWHEYAENLVCLQQLESLSITFIAWRHATINKKIRILKNLRSLEFHYMRVEWKEIKVLSKLPRLEVLKLFYPMEGEKWKLPENVKFCKLICLAISSFHLKRWEASAYHFPKLERLLLCDCYQLRKIPNSFVEIQTLNLIKLRRCLDSAVMSAKQIQAEQHDYGNENMIVIEEETCKIAVFSNEDETDEDEFDEDETDEDEFDEDVTNEDDAITDDLFVNKERAKLQ